MKNISFILVLWVEVCLSQPVPECNHLLGRVLRQGYVGIVDAFSSGNLLAEAFRAKGYEPIHIRSDLSHSPRTLATFRSQDFLASNRIEVGDFNKTLQILKTRSRIDFIIAGQESGVMFAEKLSAALGLRSNRPAGIRARRSKYHMHEALRRKGIEIIAETLARTEKQAIDWIRLNLGTWSEIGSVIIKPGLAHSTTQVYRCHNDQEVAKALNELIDQPNAFGLINKTVILQPFIKGTEYAINSASTLDGYGRLQTRVTDVWRYTKHTDQAGAPQYGYEELLAWEEIPEGLVAKNQEVLKALLFQVGASHGEFFVTPEGKILLVEMAARLYGSGNPLIAGASTDYGQVEGTIDAYTNPNRLLSQVNQPYQRNYLGLVYNINAPESDVPLRFTAEPVEEMKEHIGPHLFRLLIFAQHGAGVTQTQNLGSTLAQVEVRIPVTDPDATLKAERYLQYLHQLDTTHRFLMPGQP